MPVAAINPMTSSVSILFADPTRPLPSPSELQENDAICVDLDLCSRKRDGSLGSECVALIENAEANDVDVILAAKTVRFYEVPGLDEFSVTLVEKPEIGLTGTDLATWVAEQLSRAMGLSGELRRGLRSSKSVGDSEPGEVSAVQLESNLTKEQEEAFLDFVGDSSSQTKTATRPLGISKKLVAAKAAHFVPKNFMPSKAGVMIKAHSGATVAAAKLGKGSALKAAGSPKAMVSAASGAGPRRKA